MATNAAVKTVTREITLPPTSTSSFYVFSDQDGPNSAWGCDARRRGEQGYVIMIFGSPRLINGTTFGTRLRAGNESFVTTDDINRIVQSFARGYMGDGCAPTDGPRPRDADLRIIVATSNSKIGTGDNPALTSQHGQAWAQMITNINTALQGNYRLDVTAYGGYDAEPNWSTYPTTLRWAEGYNQAARYVYFHIGSCDGCLRHEPRTEWATRYADKFRVIQQTYQLSWGLTWSRALPQIYLYPYAYEWYNVARYAAEQGQNMVIDGVSSSCTTTACTINDAAPWNQQDRGDWLSPLQAWQAMHDVFGAATTPETTNGNPSGQSLGRANPIRRQISPPMTDFINGANP